MKRLVATLGTVFFGMLSGTSPLAAQIILDGFLDNTVDVNAPGSPSSVITNNIDGTTIDRQISVEASGDGSIVSTVLDGFLVVDAGGSTGSANAQIEYLGFEIDLAGDTYFQVVLGKVVGSPILGLILGNAGQEQISGGLQLSPSNSPQTYFLNITEFAGYTSGFGSELNSVLVLFGGANQDFFVEADSFQFVSVPEPSSSLLLSLGLGALFTRRRNSS